MTDPYTSPSPSGPPSGPPVLEPKSLKTFGVLHLVFGIIGVIGILWGIVSLFLGNFMASLQSSGDEALFELQKGLNESLLLTNVIGLIFSIVVTFFILRASFKLLKGKKDGAKASITYALVSIVFKGLTIIVSLAITVPTMNKYFSKIRDLNGGSSTDSFIEVMKTTTSVSSVVMPILMCTYPILSWVMLRRKPVKDYLEQFGK